MSKTFVYNEIGGRIRELRGKERQRDWATKIGCDQGYISQVENGVTKPSLSFLKGVASITNASIDWILTGRGSKAADAFGFSDSPRDSRHADGSNGEDTLKTLSGNPKLLLGVERLLRMDSVGRGILIELAEMEEARVEGLAAFMGLRKD